MNPTSAREADFVNIVEDNPIRHIHIASKKDILGRIDALRTENPRYVQQWKSSYLHEQLIKEAKSKTDK